MSDKLTEQDLGVKMALLLYRFDQNTHLSDITADPIALEILHKHNTRDTWR